MIIVNTANIPGKEIKEALGLVKGNTIRAKHIGKDILAGLRHLVGGELTEYEELLKEAREEALRRMEIQAKELGADAIINVRLASASISQGAAEVLAYGTAVKLA